MHDFLVRITKIRNTWSTCHDNNIIQFGTFDVAFVDDECNQRSYQNILCMPLNDAVSSSSNNKRITIIIFGLIVVLLVLIPLFLTNVVPLLPVLYARVVLLVLDYQVPGTVLATAVVESQLVHLLQVDTLYYYISSS
jgi:hypothetical protein